MWRLGYFLCVNWIAISISVALLTSNRVNRVCLQRLRHTFWQLTTFTVHWHTAVGIAHNKICCLGMYTCRYFHHIVSNIHMTRLFIWYIHGRTYWLEVRLVELFSRVGSRCCLQFRGVSQSRVQCTTLLTNYKRGTVNWPPLTNGQHGTVLVPHDSSINSECFSHFVWIAGREGTWWTPCKHSYRDAEASIIRIDGRIETDLTLSRNQLSGADTLLFGLIFDLTGLTFGS